jgi:hypothetical protein
MEERDMSENLKYGYLSVHMLAVAVAATNLSRIAVEVKL